MLRAIDWSGSSRSEISSAGSMQSRPNDVSSATIDLYWIPLGAGGRVVRWNGKAYEAIKALVERRHRYDLYHTALEISVSVGRFVIESAPIRDDRGLERGVIGEGPVGTRWLGRFRLFRYEIRLWPGGSIPDAREAVSSPVRVSNDAASAERIVELTRSVQMLVWGRDELRTGDMWNSNSLTSWLLARGGVATSTLHPPAGGRAPGWNAGLELARRQMERCTRSGRTAPP